MAEEEVSDSNRLKFIHDELKTIRLLMSKSVNAEVEAEGEIPEKIRRFVVHLHALHDIVNMYKELGHQAPDYILREMERCDDRFRQLLEEQNTDGGTFEKVRREMASDPANKWDHTRALAPPKET